MSNPHRLNVSAEPVLNVVVSLIAFSVWWVSMNYTTAFLSVMLLLFIFCVGKLMTL